MGYEHVIPQFIERLLDRHDPFHVYGADQHRAFCYVSDAVDAIIALTDLPTRAELLVNVGNDAEETRIEDLARLVFDVGDHRPTLRAWSAPPLSPQRRVPDLSLLRSLTGYRPRVGLREGVQRTYDWYARARADLTATT
jgi:UDP-glucuronate decarboxylase